MSSRRVVADHGSDDRREMTIAPDHPSPERSGAASMWVSPYALRACSAIRSAVACAASFATALAAVPNPDRRVEAHGSAGRADERLVEAPAARRVVDGATPGRALMSVAWSAFASGIPAGDDDVVGPGAVRQLLDDGPDDGVLGDRSGEPGQDPGERLGLGPTAVLEIGDGPAMPVGGDPDDERERRHDPVERLPAVDQQARQQQDREQDERVGEDPPGASDALVWHQTVRLAGGWWVGSRWKQRMRVRMGPVHPGTSTPVRGSTSVLLGRQAAVSDAAAASCPPPRLTW